MSHNQLTISKVVRRINYRCSWAGAYSLILLLVLIWSVFSSSTAVHAQMMPPYFQSSDCPIQLLDSMPVHCGTLIVPADYEQPDGPTMSLPVIIISSRSENPAPDPILFTEGGPAYTSLTAVWWLTESALRDDRDIIILEQRGNIYAQPDLTCDITVLWQETDGSTPCLDSLRAQGIDLAQFTSRHIAADIISLRQAMDIEQWNLYGTSYSTRLMQLVMNLEPSTVRSVILQSVSPLDDTRYAHDPEQSARVLQVMLDGCAADAGCSAAYPQLETQLYGLIKELNNNPVPYDFVDPENGEAATVTVDGDRFISWMAGDAFYGPAFPPHKTAFLPLLIDQVAQGNTELLYPWLNDELIGMFDMSMAWAWGLYFAVNCQDDAPGVTAEYMEQQTAVYPQLDGYIRHAEELAVCRAWNLPPAPPLTIEPFHSDIPVLILAGSYDPITPPSWGKALSEKLIDSQFFEFPASGHNVGSDNPCAEIIKQSFVNDPTAVLNPSCLAELPDPAFILPDEIAIAPGVYHIIHDAEIGNPERGKLWLEIIAGASFIIFLVEIVYLLVKAVFWLVRRPGGQTGSDLAARIGHPLAGVTAVVAWFSMRLITIINNYLLTTTPITLYFGFAKDHPYVIILGAAALLFIILTISLLPILFLAWKRRYWFYPERLLFTLVTLAAILFTILLIRWDLHTLIFP